MYCFKPPLIGWLLALSPLAVVAVLSGVIGADHLPWFGGNFYLHFYGWCWQQ
jgi:hypothetical protein